MLLSSEKQYFLLLLSPEKNYFGKLQYFLIYQNLFYSSWNEEVAPIAPKFMLPQVVPNYFPSRCWSGGAPAVVKGPKELESVDWE